MLSKSDIVRLLAEQTCGALTQAGRRDLQRMHEGLKSGDDSGLGTIWDEVCVQAQGEESLLWDAYEDTIQTLAVKRVQELPEHIKTALWYQTDNGLDYLSEWEGEASPWPEPDSCNPDEDVARYLYQQVMRLAGGWTNGRIRVYLDRHSARGETDFVW